MMLMMMIIIADHVPVVRMGVSTDIDAKIGAVGCCAAEITIVQYGG